MTDELSGSHPHIFLFEGLSRKYLSFKASSSRFLSFFSAVLTFLAPLQSISSQKKQVSWRTQCSIVTSSQCY
ncbi:hypothetical protein COCCADRAFT_113916 [Bipolaris zeicola 26-R-13]|uniref:Uncharacterized protein n=1 Tax=Cochliobolus carbonum (strain 26-R-13) TaxID=930089 RepID=W6XMT0_COCC2|nr:uncharacterized protein COCCADRAFT_113916 [Bipolaris zeicola 26-R-13]EUC26600.1 hypothetical protein COCCADRAFT_113916 [Bipolaris zeicola 26-R-13]